jgi:hypothetical protein
MADITIDSIDKDQASAAEAFLVDWLKVNYPSLDLSEGRVLRDILIRPAALFYALNQTNLQVMKNSMSVAAIEGNVEPVDDTIVDLTVSNFKLTRIPGVVSTGKIAIVLSTLRTTSVPVGTVFTLGELTFVTETSFVGVTTSDAVLDSTTQRLITQRTDGNYSFIIDVVASTAGSQYAIRRNTTFESVSPAIPSMITSYASEDFTTGQAEETNQELMARFQQAISPAVYSGRTHIASRMLAANENIRMLSIIGYGDAEMLRDRHNIFAVSHGGKADIYVRTRDYPQTILVNKTATLIDANTKTFQVTLGRDDAPGFYTVESVLPANAPQDQGTLEVTSVTKGLDLSQTTNEFVPEIATLIEGAYSRYQTAVIRFVDPTNDGSNMSYDVYVNYMPGLADLQSDSINRDNRNPQADYLVRAPIPAYASVSMLIQYTTSELPNTDSIKQAVADAVNALTFSLGQLPASIIHDAVYTVLDKRYAVVVSPLDIYCRIHKPDGTIVAIRSPNGISAPSEPENCVTSRTTLFYLTPASVDITLQRVQTLPV